MAQATVVITVFGGKDLQAPIDPAFGRAERFLLVDVEAGEVIEALDNPAAQAAGGAGTQAANLVARSGASAVISGGFGPKAAAGLRALGVAMYASSSAKNAGEALAAYRSGKLTPF
jgi:predicted Fe-Mo cluster-binding NifX family protein